MKTWTVFHVLSDASITSFSSFLVSTMRMKPLPHYFPAASVRSLQKSNYELVGDKVFSEEEKSLHQTLTEYKNADKRSRLTSDNYHSMLKLMLQMEDEIASTKCLSYDQENQVVNCVRDRIYSLKIVSRIRLRLALCFTDGDSGLIFICRTIKRWTKRWPSTHVCGSPQCRCDWWVSPATKQFRKF